LKLAPFVSVALAGAALSAPAAASADLRIWQEEPAHPATDPDDVEERYFDLTAYIQPGYIWREDDDETERSVALPVTDDHFWVHRARLGFRTLLYPWLLLRLELETTPSASLTDGYVDFRPMRELSVRIGQYKVPFLRSAAFSESNTAFIDPPLYLPATPDRSFLRYLDARDIGVMLHGVVGDRDFGPAVSYGAGLFLGRGANQTRDDDGVLMLAARVQGHITGVPVGDGVENDLARNERPRIGVGAGVLTNCDDREQFNRGFTVDAEFRYAGIYASAAFVRFKNGPARENVVGQILGYDSDDACAPDPTSPLPDHVAWGAHVQAQYLLPPPVFPVDGQSLEVLVRWDVAQPYEPPEGLLGGDTETAGYIAPSTYDVEADDPPDQWRLTFGVNWYPTDETRLRLGLNYQLRRESEHVLPAGSSGPTIVGVTNDILWLQLTVGL